MVEGASMILTSNVPHWLAERDSIDRLTKKIPKKWKVLTRRNKSDFSQMGKLEFTGRISRRDSRRAWTSHLKKKFISPNYTLPISHSLCPLDPPAHQMAVTH